MGTSGDELVVFHLDLHEEIECAEPVEQRRGARVVVDAVMGDVPCHAHHSRVLECFEIGGVASLATTAIPLQRPPLRAMASMRQRLSRP